MSVYTNLDAVDIQPLLDHYQQGKLVDYRGIAAGIENTNYFVTAESANGDTREFVLTLFETTSSENLSGYFDLMAHLASQKLPVAEPCQDRNGHFVYELKNKPAALVSRLAGASTAQPNADQCQAVGRFLAAMHELTQRPNDQLSNTRGADWRQRIMVKLFNADIREQQQLITMSHQAAVEFEHADLPRGIVHGDLFHDNALFLENELTGIIDFYYAHHSPLIYDLAVCIADWCFVLNHGELALDNARAIISGYRQQRNISLAEAAAWTKSLELAGLRFYLSRLHDKHFPRPGAITQEKDPEAFLNLIKLCRENPAELNSILSP